MATKTNGTLEEPRAAASLARTVQLSSFFGPRQGEPARQVQELSPQRFMSCVDSTLPSNHNYVQPGSERLLLFPEDLTKPALETIPKNRISHLGRGHETKAWP